MLGVIDTRKVQAVLVPVLSGVIVKEVRARLVYVNEKVALSPDTGLPPSRVLKVKMVSPEVIEFLSTNLSLKVLTMPP